MAMILTFTNVRDRHQTILYLLRPRFRTFETFPQEFREIQFFKETMGLLEETHQFKTGLIILDLFLIILKQEMDKRKSVICEITIFMEEVI